MKQHLSIAIIAAFVISIVIGGVQIATTQNRLISLPTPQRQVPVVAGQVTTWGNASSGLHAVPAGAITNVAQLAMGARHALALTTSGNVIGWGINRKGELTIPANLNDVIQISVGISHSVALKRDGSVVLWGDATSNVLSSTVSLPTDVVQIAAGDRHTALLRVNGTVVVAGIVSQRTIPSDLTGKIIVAVAAGSDSTLALDSTGSLYQWGGPSLPSMVVNDVTAIFARGNVYGAVRSTGELVVWGDIADITPTAATITLDTVTSNCPCLRIANMSAMQSLVVAKWGIVIVQRNGLITALPHDGASIPSSIPNRVL
jgi:alpha-tubulin suppressor-like RCC1 family protein